MQAARARTTQSVETVVQERQVLHCSSSLFSAVDGRFAGCWERRWSAPKLDDVCTGDPTVQWSTCTTVLRCRFLHRSTGCGRPLARRRHARRLAERRSFWQKCRLADGLKTAVVRALKTLTYSFVNHERINAVDSGRWWLRVREN
jgi:hypothetical protein